MSTDAITLVVIVTTKPGKGEQFCKTSEEYYRSFKDNEPDTIQFQFNKESTGADENGNERWCLVERFKSKAALDAHRAADGHAKLFKDFQELDLVEGIPIMFEGSPLWGHAEPEKRTLAWAAEREAVAAHGPLPSGWEAELTTEHKLYYIDHNSKKTTWTRPGRSGESTARHGDPSNPNTTATEAPRNAEQAASIRGRL